MKKVLLIGLMLMVFLVSKHEVMALAPCVLNPTFCIVDNTDGGSIPSLTYNFTADNPQTYSFDLTPDVILYVDDADQYDLENAIVINGLYIVELEANIETNTCSTLGHNYLRTGYFTNYDVYVMSTTTYRYTNPYSFYLGDQYYLFYNIGHQVYQVYDICSQYIVIQITDNLESIAEYPQVDPETEPDWIQDGDIIYEIIEFVVNQLDGLDMSGEDVALNIIDSGISGGSYDGPLELALND